MYTSDGRSARHDYCLCPFARGCRSAIEGTCHACIRKIGDTVTSAINTHPVADSASCLMGRGRDTAAVAAKMPGVEVTDVLIDVVMSLWRGYWL